MAVIGLAIAIPVTIIVRGSGDDDEPVAAPSVAEELPLNPAVNDRELHARYSVPKGWSQKEAKDTRKLHSKDGSVQVGISTPGSAKDSGEILDAALASLRESYKAVDVSPGSGKRVGGLPAKGAVVQAASHKVRLSILVAVATGEKRSYLVEVFTAADAPERPVAEAQRFLDSLRFTA